MRTVSLVMSPHRARQRVERLLDSAGIIVNGNQDWDPQVHDERFFSRVLARYDQRFRRMWRYYLLMSAAGFRTRRMQLWQLVLSPHGVVGGYLAPR